MKNNTDRPLTFGEFTLFVKNFEDFRRDYLGFKKDVLALKRLTQNSLDRVFKVLTDMQTEMKAFYALYQRHDAKFTNHNQRLVKLESALTSSH